MTWVSVACVLHQKVQYLIGIAAVLHPITFGEKDTADTLREEYTDKEKL